MSNTKKVTYYPSKLATLIQLANLAIDIKEVKITFTKDNQTKSQHVAPRYAWSLQTALLLNALKELGCKNVQDIYHRIVEDYYTNKLSADERKTVESVTKIFDKNFNHALDNLTDIVKKVYPHVSLSVTKDKLQLTAKQKQEVENLLEMAIAANMGTIVAPITGDPDIEDNSNTLRIFATVAQVKVLTQYLGINKNTVFKELTNTEQDGYDHFFTNLEQTFAFLDQVLDSAMQMLNLGSGKQSFIDLLDNLPIK